MAKSTKVKRVVDNLDTKKLKNYIEDNHIKNTVLSQDLGYDASYLNKVCKGLIKMNSTAYKMMCLIFQVDESEFLKEEPTTTTVKVDNTAPVMVHGVDPAQVEKMLNAMSDMVAVGDRIADVLESLVVALGVKPTSDSKHVIAPTDKLHTDAYNGVYKKENA